MEHLQNISAKVVKVIETRTSIRTGTQEDPSRILIQYWSPAGKLLAEHDTFMDEAAP